MFLTYEVCKLLQSKGCKVKAEYYYDKEWEEAHPKSKVRQPIQTVNNPDPKYYVPAYQLTDIKNLCSHLHNMKGSKYMLSKFPNNGVVELALLQKLMKEFYYCNDGLLEVSKIITNIINDKFIGENRRWEKQQRFWVAEDSDGTIYFRSKPKFTYDADDHNFVFAVTGNGGCGYDELESVIKFPNMKEGTCRSYLVIPE